MRDAMIALQDTVKPEDPPISHFLLAPAALGEITSLRYLPQFTYHLAQAQEGLGSPQATASYQAFLAMTHEPDADDRFVVEARRHLK